MKAIGSLLAIVITIACLIVGLTALPGLLHATSSPGLDRQTQKVGEAVADVLGVLERQPLVVRIVVFGIGAFVCIGSLGRTLKTLEDRGILKSGAISLACTVAAVIILGLFLMKVRMLAFPVTSAVLHTILNLVLFGIGTLIALVSTASARA